MLFPLHIDKKKGLLKNQKKFLAPNFYLLSFPLKIAKTSKRIFFMMLAKLEIACTK